MSLNLEIDFFTGQAAYRNVSKISQCIALHQRSWSQKQLSSHVYKLTIRQFYIQFICTCGDHIVIRCVVLFTAFISINFSSLHGTYLGWVQPVPRPSHGSVQDPLQHAKMSILVSFCLFRSSKQFMMAEALSRNISKHFFPN